MGEGSGECFIGTAFPVETGVIEAVGALEVGDTWLPDIGLVFVAERRWASSVRAETTLSTLSLESGDEEVEDDVETASSLSIP